MSNIVRFLVCLVLGFAFLGVSPTPAAAADDFDLQPTSVEVANLYAGVSNTVTVVVANNGTDNITDFDVKLEASENGGDFTEIATLSGYSILGYMETYYWPVSVKFDWTPPNAADYELRATVDSAGTIAETEEGNNVINQAVTVIPADPITVNVRVEGQTGTIWDGDVTFFSSTITDKYGSTYTLEVPTAMGAIHAASAAGGFNLVIDSKYGPIDYVEEVAGEVPVLEAPYPGWMFRVNWDTTDIGATDYGLADGDSVLWSYTIWGVEPLRTTVSGNSILSGNSFDITVEAYDGSNWETVSDMPVHVGTLTYTTDGIGMVSGLTLDPGSYTVYADTGDYTQYIRSNKETVLVYLPLNLQTGWNFISVPKRLADGYSIAQQVFGAVDTAGHSIFTYDPVNGWTALGTDDVIQPLDGIWIYSAAEIELHPSFDTDPLNVPPTKQLSAGWTAIGYSDFTSAAADSALTSVEDCWTILMGFDAATQTYDVSIINNAPPGDIHDEDREMNCWKGYWLHVSDSCQLAGISS